MEFCLSEWMNGWMHIDGVQNFTAELRCLLRDKFLCAICYYFAHDYHFKTWIHQFTFLFVWKQPSRIKTRYPRIHRISYSVSAGEIFSERFCSSVSVTVWIDVFLYLFNMERLSYRLLKHAVVMFLFLLLAGWWWWQRWVKVTQRREKKKCKCWFS